MYMYRNLLQQGSDVQTQFLNYISECRKQGPNDSDRLGCLGVAYKALENADLRGFNMKALDTTFECARIGRTIPTKDLSDPRFKPFYEAVKTKILLTNL